MDAALRTVLFARAKGTGPVVQQVAGHCQFPSRAVANPSGYTQYQGRKSFFLYRDVTDLRFTIGNLLSTGPALTALPTATVRLGLFDPATSIHYPVTFNGGAASVTLANAAMATSDPVAFVGAGGPGTSGKKLMLIKYVTWATAPANLPAQSAPLSSFDYNEWGASLTDKTAGGTWTAARPAGAFDIFPALAITGTTAARGPVVGVLGDSISSDSASDASTDYNAGYATSALADLAVPHVNIGISSLSLAVFLSGGHDAKRALLYQLLSTAGVTHLLDCLGTNDWAVPRTSAQLAADKLILKGQMAALGIRHLPITLQPKTNAANTGQNGAETATFVQRDLFNAQMMAANGTGDGVLDLASAVQSPGDPRLWRTDLLRLASVAVTSGGTGHGVNDIHYLANGIRLRPTTVSGGAVTAVALRRTGGFVVAPASPAALLETLKDSAIGGGAGGTGVTYALTTTAAGLDVDDGIHPKSAYHSMMQTRAASDLPALLGV